MVGWLAIVGGALAAMLVGAGLTRRGRLAVGAGEHSRMEPLALRHSLVVLVAGVLLALGAAGLTFRYTDDESDKDRFDMAIKAAATVAALGAGLLTWARLELSRREHHLAARVEENRSGAETRRLDEVAAEQRLTSDRLLSERYGRAVELLGHADEIVRVGGVFAMESFALDAAARRGDERDVDWCMALDVLAAFARTRSQQLGQEGDEQSPGSPSDIVEAVRVLGRFQARAGRDTAGPSLARVVLTGASLRDVHLAGADLTGADLTGADLIGADFSRADLSAAILSRARLYHASFSDAILVGACLTRARLIGASLRGADLSDADLSGASCMRANLAEAHLTGATLTETKLPSAILTDAMLHRARLDRALLTGAKFDRSNLTETDLTGAVLTGSSLAEADLTQANLAGAILTGADLRGADLWGADLTRAVVVDLQHDSSTQWPSGFTP